MIASNWTYQEWEDAIVGISNLADFDAVDLKEFVLQRWVSGDSASTPEKEYDLYVDLLVASYYE